jgi:glycosyltransferase involved in cell wall biosynthesis
VIVIDDGSTDNSVEVIEGFARKDPIVRLYRNEQNQGVIFSLNRGLNLAAGEYIIFSAADDRVCPGCFEKSMELLAQYPQAGLCSALLQLIGEDGGDKGWIKSPVISKTACFLPPEKVLTTLTRYGFWFTG